MQVAIFLALRFDLKSPLALLNLSNLGIFWRLLFISKEKTKTCWVTLWQSTMDASLKFCVEISEGISTEVAVLRHNNSVLKIGTRLRVQSCSQFLKTNSMILRIVLLILLLLFVCNLFSSILRGATVPDR